MFDNQLFTHSKKNQNKYRLTNVEKYYSWELPI